MRLHVRPARSPPTGTCCACPTSTKPIAGAGCGRDRGGRCVWFAGGTGDHAPDTHFILWIALRSKRLRAYPWIDRYSPWALSPVSLLGIGLFGVAGRFPVPTAEF